MLARISKTPLLNVQKFVLARSIIATPAIKYERDPPSFTPRPHYGGSERNDVGGRRSFQPRGNDSGRNVCHKCGSADHFIRDCPEKPKVSCFRCGQDGHMARECTQVVENERVVKCHNCGGEGHIARMCPEPRKPRDETWQRPERSMSRSEDGESAYMRRPMRNRRDSELSGVTGADDEGAMRSQLRDESEVVCWHCNLKGHSSRNCPTKPVDECWNCGGEGHRSHDCPEPRKERAPRSASAGGRGGSRGGYGGRSGAPGGRGPGGRTPDRGWTPRHSTTGGEGA